jgi:UDP:flavonoid glycosyltransferase YjiC (YdhE family)
MTNITELKIDFVAPPLAGHLFPQLQLARYLKLQGFNRLRFFTTPKFCLPIEQSGIEFRPVLADKENDVLAISHTEKQVMNSIKGMFASVTNTLNIRGQFSDELRTYWKIDKPDLVIVDFLSPFAGVVAENNDIPWWTACSSPCFIEFRKGTPAFFGGWEPPKTFLGTCRDALGRALVRQFKRTVFFLFRKQIQNLGFKSIYREDGSERMFSPEVILGLGASELEFDNDFPKSMKWIGPCPESPVFDHSAPDFEQGKKHILISLGTQISWAKERAEKIFLEVARSMPEIVFHFVLGNTHIKDCRKEGNIHFYGYVPYTPDSFKRYDVIVDHGGIGVLYTALLAAVPQLVFPQDFDQHDCAARISAKKLGLRTSGKVGDIVQKLKKLLDDSLYRTKAAEFQKIAQRYTPGETFLQLIKERFGE